MDRHPKPLIDALTGVRFFAAFSVFNLHYFYYLRPRTSSYHIPDFVLSILDSGVAGISLFFMLSGFVLAYAYPSIMPTRPAAMRFLASRFARIYPVYFLALVGFAPFILCHRFSTEAPLLATEKSIASLLPSVLLIQSWFHPRFAVSWNGPGWTLSVEFVFYLLFPVIAPRIRALSHPGKLWLALVCWAVSMALSMIDPLLLSPSEFNDGLVSFNPIFHLPTFISGVALGYHFAARRSATNGTLMSGAGLLLICLIAPVSHSLPPLLVHNAVFLPAFGLLLYGLASGGWPAQLLSKRPMVLLGESSYALYILQFPLLYTLMFANEGGVFYDFIKEGNRQPILSGWVFYVVSALASIAVSVLVFKRFEAPMRERVRSWLFASFTERTPSATRVLSQK